MTLGAAPKYELFYWSGIPGRGEFIRLAFEEAGVAYVDFAQIPEDEGGGDRAILHLLETEEAVAAFAPPILRCGDLLIAQTANILQWLGPRLGLSPTDERGRLAANQVQLTIADLVGEAHDVHHPVAVSLYYEEQKATAKRRAAYFRGERLPRYLGHFERLFGTRRYAVGDALSYVDLSLFLVVSGIAYAFPRAWATLRPRHPRLSDLHDRVAARPRLAAYLASPHRVGFNEQGVFRHYPELDGEL
jgi:glutathione S-transferase